MESWLKAFFELPHHTSSKGRIISVWMQMIAFSLQSLRLLLSCSPSPPIPHCIFKHGPYSCAPWTCFMHTKKRALHGSFSLCHSVCLDEFFAFQVPSMWWLPTVRGGSVYVNMQFWLKGILSCESTCPSVSPPPLHLTSVTTFSVFLDISCVRLGLTGLALKTVWTKAELVKYAFDGCCRLCCEKADDYWGQTNCPYIFFFQWHKIKISSTK